MKYNVHTKNVQVNVYLVFALFIERVALMVEGMLYIIISRQEVGRV